MIGRLGFENHRIRCIIGIGDLERSREQDILVDLSVLADISRCAETDDLADTIDYMALADLCSNLAKENAYQLLEKFASDVLESIFDLYQVEEAWIRVKKPKAIPTADFSIVELKRTRV
jgi:FolB domain-containing protein